MIDGQKRETIRKAFEEMLDDTEVSFFMCNEKGAFLMNPNPMILLDYAINIIAKNVSEEAKKNVMAELTNLSKIMVNKPNE